MLRWLPVVRLSERVGFWWTGARDTEDGFRETVCIGKGQTRQPQRKARLMQLRPQYCSLPAEKGLKHPVCVIQPPVIDRYDIGRYAIYPRVQHS